MDAQMIDHHYNNMETVQPEPYQLIIMSNGRNFRSGCWVPLDDDTGMFLTDSNGPFECLYWIPLPTGLK
jgi:hypothetical protein